VHSQPNPLVVQYLYVHGQDEAFFYPSVRASSSAAAVARRYLECALVQAASLRLRDTDCDLALATNIGEPRALGRASAELLRRIEDLGVDILHTEYRHRPGDNSATYVSSRYVLDAMLAAADGQAPQRRLLFTDLDCVWVAPERLFAAVPAAPQVGCIHFTYPPDWDVVGFGEVGRTPNGIGVLAGRYGGDATTPPWVGGELLAGTPDAVRALVAACEQLDARLAADGHVLPTEEQVLTLAGALGEVRFSDLSAMASRIQTGPRHEAPPVQQPLSLSLWHLPGEKGLSLRRAAQQLRRGRSRGLRRDLADPARMARRFNVAGNGLVRRLRDDGWIAGRRLFGAARTLRAGVGQHS
jgi:hypothetical protein